MRVYTISEAREKLFKVAQDTLDTHQPVMILSKKQRLVLMSGDDYAAMQETFYIQSIKGLEKSILKGLKEPLSECATEIDWNAK